MNYATMGRRRNGCRLCLSKVLILGLAACACSLAYPTMPPPGAAAEPMDLEHLVDATELPWLSKLESRSFRGEAALEWKSA